MSENFDATCLEKVSRAGFVAVLVIDRADDAQRVGELLLEKGIGAVELTLRTEAAVEALRSLRRHAPQLVLGLGTVLTEEQLKLAVDEGVDFAVSPGLNPRVVESAARRALPFAPGVQTPSDIESALAVGCRFLKFFPAETAGGLAHLQMMGSPYAHLGLKYLPLGGIEPPNLRQYLEHEWVAAVGGSWVAPRRLIRQRDWSAIAERAERVAALVEATRQNGPGPDAAVR